MKSVISIFLALLFMSFPAIVTAANAPVNKVVYLTRKKTNNRPGAPVSGEIVCFLSDDEITFELPANSESALAIFANSYNDVELAQYVTVDFPSVDITGLSGEYTLTVTTDTGKVFEGVIEL